MDTLQKVLQDRKQEFDNLVSQGYTLFTRFEDAECEVWDTHLFKVIDGDEKWQLSRYVKEISSHEYTDGRLWPKEVVIRII